MTAAPTTPVGPGATTTFTVTPQTGYTATVTGCGGTLIGYTYTTGAITVNLWVGCAILFIAAVVGNITGYWIGYKAGPPLFNRPDSRFFKNLTHHGSG